VSRVVEVVRRAGKTGILTSDVCDEVAARIPVKNEVSRTLSLASQRGLVVKDRRNGVDHRWFAVEKEGATPRDPLADFDESYGCGAEAWAGPEGQKFLRTMRGGV
jgi:hypothetical protein